MLAVLWSLLAVLSFWCWVATIGIGIARAFPKGRRYDVRLAFYVGWGGACLWLLLGRRTVQGMKKV